MTKPPWMSELTLAGILCLCMCFPLSVPALALAQVPVGGASDGFVRAEAPGVNSATEDVGEEAASQRIRFEFEQADWQDVIPWFAKQAGFSLQPISDWPEGTFHLVDRSEYTVIDALDQLNHALRLRTPPYTLVRNRNMLILTRVDQADFPAELIETVTVDELDSRGKYETLRCVFEFGELNCRDFDEQLSQLVSQQNRSAYAVFEGANQILVRETGARLRVMRDIILAARQRQSAKDATLTVYRLKNLDADSFMFVARDLLGMKEDANQREDGSLSLSAEPLSDRLFVKGTRLAVQQFKEVAALLDVPPDAVDGATPIDKPYFRSYAVTSDPKLAFDVLQTFLAGRDGVRMQQDEATGAIAVMGRAADHQVVTESLAIIEGGNGTQFAIVPLKHADPSNVIFTLRSLWGQTTDLEPKGPVLLGDSIQRTVIVRGTPAEVTQVKAMIAQLDDPALSLSDGPRSRTRVISVEDAKRDEILGTLEDYWPSTGRGNRLRLNLVMPKDRSTLSDRLRGFPRNDDWLGEPLPESQGGDDGARGTNGVKTDDDMQRLLDLKSSFHGATNDAMNWRRDILPRLRVASKYWARHAGRLPSAVGLWAMPGFRFANAFQGASALGSAASLNSMLVVRPQNLSGSSDLSLGTTSPSGGSSSRRADSDYVPPAKIESVPGAEIEVKPTAGGIVISSYDLDALDDMEALIRDQVGLKSEKQAPTFFYLKHRYAEDVASFLQGYFGLAGASGDGDGGAGGLLGGVLNNVVGGGSGDLLGGLMGGAGGLDTVDAMLEGDVRFGTDSAFNTLYVAGATTIDLERISEVIEVLDQPNAPQDPELLGTFRTIPIVHRDPQEVKDIVEAQLADLIQVGGSGGDEGGGNEANQQLAQIVQRMAGGGGDEGGGAVSSGERPKARLGVDLKTSQLLVTGPEFIYKEVLKMVLELDQPQLSAARTYVVIPNGGKNSDLLVKNLKAIFGSKIEIEGDDGDSSSSSSETEKKDASSNRDSSEQQQARQQQQQQAQQRMLRQLRQQQQQRGGGGNGRDGGGRGGGGGGRNGGGGRGGR